MTRNRFAIHRDILMLCQQPTRKTTIQRKYNMSYTMLEKYLRKLVDRECLMEGNGQYKGSYQTTHKGTQLIEAYGLIEAFLENKP